MIRLMRVLALCLAVGAGGRLAAAGTMLYATAASQNRVDGFCVGDKGGGLAASPSVSVALNGASPRRALVANGVLYVGEDDRVEAFAIGPHGGLRRLTGTNHVDPAMRVADMAFSPDGRTLYVAQNGYGRVVAYPLDAEGGLSPDFTSCIQGKAGTSYLAILVNGELLYTSEQLTDRIATFPIGADGSLPAAPSTCVLGTTTVDRPPATATGNVSCGANACEKSVTKCCVGAPRIACTADADCDPLAGTSRTKITGLRSILIVGDMLYAEAVDAKKIVAFRLQGNGLFAPSGLRPNGKKFLQQKAESRTAQIFWYADLHFYAKSLIASQFKHGRIDAYRLKADGKLPKQPTRFTKANVAATPVRMTISPDGVLYVAGGELDSVQAFHLRPTDGLPARTPFSQTTVQTGSFPNDVALAVLSDGCS